MLLPKSAGRKNGPLLGAIFLSAAAHLAILRFWPVVASGAPTTRPVVALEVSWQDAARSPEAAPLPDSRVVVMAQPNVSGQNSPGHLRSEFGDAMADDQAPEAEALAWDVRYFSPRSLDLIPVAKQYGIPTVQGVEEVLVGEVRVEVFIEADGSVAHVALISVGDLPPEYGKAASSALYRSRFSPGIRAGVAVPVRLKIVVKFGAPGL